MEGGTNKNKIIKIEKFNMKYKIQIHFFKPKLHYKPTCEVGSV
jgi:hypothetical protein